MILHLLTNFRLFSNISRGSVVTRLRCGEIFNNRSIANFLTSMSVQKIKIKPIFDEVMRKPVFSTKIVSSDELLRKIPKGT